MDIFGKSTIGTSGDSRAISKVVLDDADSEDPFIGIPESQGNYIHHLFVLDAKTEDEIEIQWDEDVPQEARRHAFR